MILSLQKHIVAVSKKLFNGLKMGHKEDKKRYVSEIRSIFRFEDNLPY